MPDTNDIVLLDAYARTGTAPVNFLFVEKAR